MARPGIKKEQVFAAADKLEQADLKVTVDQIRFELGCGSRTTINKYLNAWKESRAEYLKSSSSSLEKRLKAKNSELEKMLEAQAKQLEELSSTLLEKDREILNLKETIENKSTVESKLNQELEAQRFETKMHAAKYDAEILCRSEIVDALKLELKELTHQYSEDLKAVNEQNFAEVRKLGRLSQDALMEERIKVKDLKEQIVLLKTRIKELEESLKKAQTATLPLRKQLQYQDRMIGHCLDPKKIERFKLGEVES